MSLKDNSVNQLESNTQDSAGEVSNNNRQEEVSSDNGDANANRIQVDEERTGEVEGFSPLLSQTEEQDKVIIWGTDSQFDDPELAEFEMLECQELEAYLAEEDDEAFTTDGLAETGSLSKSGPNEANASTSSTEEAAKGVQHVLKEPEMTSQASPSKGGNRTEVSSETDIFVSCFSSVSSLGGSLASALDNAGRSQATESCHIPSGPHRTLSEDLTIASQSCSTISERGRGSQRAAAPTAESTTHLSGVDLNLNSTVLPEEPILEAQEKEPGQSSPEECSGLLTNGVGESNRNVTNAKWEHIKLTDAEQSLGEQLNDDHQPTDAKTSWSQPQPTKLTTSDGTHSLEQHPAHPKLVPSTKKTSTTRQVAATPTHNVNGKPAKSDEASDVNVISPKPIAKSLSCQCVSPTPLIKKQASFERARSASPSSLDKRKPWGSPSRPATPPSPKTTWSPKRRPLSSPAKTTSTRAASQEGSDSPQRVASGIKPPSKVGVSTAIPKAVLHPQPEIKPATKNTSPPQKPKNVRPKIITYVRKSPQVKPPVTDGPYEVSTLPPRLTPYASPPTAKEPKATGVKTSTILSSSNLLYDKYKQEMQKTCYFGPGLVVSGIRPPSYTVPHKLTGKSESFHGELPERYMHEMSRATGGTPGPPPGAGDAAGVYRSPRALRPQLGLGAVVRQPAAKNRMMMAGQRSSLSFSQPAPGGPPTHHYQDPTVDQKKLLALEGGPKTLLPKPGQSGLRPPGFAHLPPARLAAFGFVRSASVSSVSSNQSSDSTHSDPCRSTNRPASGSGLEDVSVQRAPAPPSEPPCPVRRGSPQPPNAPPPTRRSFPPPTRSSPAVTRKEFQKDSENTKPAVSSPKRFAVVSPKPQSPVRQKSSVGRSSVQEAEHEREKEREKERERERALVENLRQRCEEQARQLQSLQAELGKASRGLEVFAITTQHFCQKSERASVKERELSHELGRIRDEVACSVARWERLRGEKQQLEERFEQELRGLRQQQQLELGALEERLSCQHRSHTHRLQRQQHQQLDELRAQHQEQVEEMTESHEATLQEMEETHNATLATLQDEHARTIRNLKMAHEQQRKSLEQEFEKLRLSLQDQVDTLTFQNRSLRDRAKRFEEALRRSTDEQIVDALAPYRHIEEDLKSLKEVLEMKNQQIHEQELKILQLEKMQAQKNVVLEERVQVLQQQNEDLKARIETNIAMSRQLSEENANLQEYVEKESNEKKRLSRNNEELLWRLQTGELSPRMSPSGSPIHRAASGSTSPSRVQNFPR
ncbi:microtubule-associated tumor suppressor candidate 2 isoform X1 [Alosa alosa]|uniref:microtubule-associated tumor suppressor candidate 2 isoform X1 n=1 Tax=Alosa alosa TaxID=278164 RepID=UPI002015186C|nr:microtubule-associated tumor suppressor candidate 2 isoform X1 [Alosa alosa]